MPRSPFPGMDPYLERVWPNVHSLLIAYITEALVDQLPPDLRAIPEDDLSIASTDAEDFCSFRPDVAVVDDGAPLDNPPNPSPAGTAIVAPPQPAVRVRLMAEPRPDRHVLIVDTNSGDRIVTAIELLSASNKATGPGNLKYLRKLRTLKDGGANIVEIDLLRSPSRQNLEVNPSNLPPVAQTHYLATIYRTASPAFWDVFPISLRNPIPPLPIPLREGESDVVLQLQPLMDRIYNVGRYFRTIKYDKPPIPPLEDSDAAWAATLPRP